MIKRGQKPVLVGDDLHQVGNVDAIRVAVQVWVHREQLLSAQRSRTHCAADEVLQVLDVLHVKRAVAVRVAKQASAVHGSPTTASSSPVFLHRTRCGDPGSRIVRFEAHQATTRSHSQAICTSKDVHINSRCRVVLDLNNVSRHNRGACRERGERDHRNCPQTPCPAAGRWQQPA